MMKKILKGEDIMVAEKSPDELKSLYREIGINEIERDANLPWIVTSSVENSESILRVGPFHFDPKAYIDNARPHAATRAMTKTEFQSLMASVEEFGVEDPVYIDHSGRVIDGYHRILACANMLMTEGRVVEIPTKLVQFGDDSKELEFVVLKNFGRRHMTSSDAKKLAEHYLLSGHDGTDALIAERAGLKSHETVTDIRVRLEDEGRIEKLTHRFDKRGHRQQRCDKRESKRPNDLPAKPATVKIAPLNELDVDFEIPPHDAPPTSALEGMSVKSAETVAMLWRLLPHWWKEHGVGIVSIKDLFHLGKVSNILADSGNEKSLTISHGRALKEGVS